MPNNVSFVETALLNTFIGEDNWTYVRIGDGFVRKKARDLHEGDLVVVNNEGIHKTLAEIEPVLEQSVRYSTANRVLHEKNNQGMDITRLRILLLEGLADPNIIDLENRIMRNDGHDFSAIDYSIFRDAVLQHVTNVGEGAVREWLSGTTLAPRDWQNFSRLSPINPEFRAIADSFGQDNGYHAAYRLYVGLRMTIMSYLAKRTGQSSVTERRDQMSYSSGPPGKYSDEIGMVMKQFMQEVDRERSAARITRLKQPGKKVHGASAKLQQSELHLTRGICTEDLNLPTMDMGEVHAAHYLLTNIIYDALNKYSLEKINEIYDMYLGSAGSPVKPTDPVAQQIMDRATASWILMPYVFINLFPNSPLERGLFRNNLKTAMEFNGATKDHIDELMAREYSRFMDQLRDGHIDAMVGAEPNTLANVIDLCRQYRSAMPQTFYQSQEMHLQAKRMEIELESFVKQHAPRRLRRDLEQELEKLRERKASKDRYLEATYPGIWSKHRRLLHAFYNDRNVGLTEDSTPNPTDSAMRQFRQRQESMGEKFFSKQDAISILEPLGVKSAVLYLTPQNFV